MEISNRLRAISDLVDKGATIADIGTDHGYIPIYLAKNNIIKHAIACDVNKKPLDKANKNIRQYNLNNYIETRLSDGLDKLNEDEVDTVIIAGMGGLLIDKILMKNADVAKSINKLILSPHSDIEVVRRTIHKLNYKIIEEKLIKEDNKYYNIICAVKGTEKKYDNKCYKYGKILIENKSMLLKEQLEKKEDKLSKVIEVLIKQNTDNANMRKKEIQQELDQISEVLKCL
ncbi:MAG: class I SAM-dependent methyltransferase [Vallitalea sp.]|jgi:tRNA (adenine22-N1)-methyltransferase|nr:class I SAM-dependent methyltransferase [Vallitalea sp.]